MQMVSEEAVLEGSSTETHNEWGQRYNHPQNDVPGQHRETSFGLNRNGKSGVRNRYSSVGNAFNRNVHQELGGGMLRTPMASNSKIMAPTVFDGAKYNIWRRDFLFWRDLYWYVSDGQLLSIVGLNASTNLKRYMVRFFRETRTNSADRAIMHLLDTLQSHFSATSKEREAYYLDEILNARRENGESIQSFWFWYEELQHQIEGANIAFPEGMMFLRLLKSINVTAHIRLALITRMDCRNMKHGAQELKRVIIELLGVYKDMLGARETAMQSTESWEGR